MARRERARDDRDFDTTQLHESGHGQTLGRDYSAHFWRWSFARRFCNKQLDVLEVGCGQDKPLAKILTRSVGFHCNSYTGVDLNPLKEGNHQRCKFIGEFNFVERYKELLKLRPEGYDVLVTFEVVEHMHSKYMPKFMRGCFELLRPGGKMLISTPVYDGVRMAANHINEMDVPTLQKHITKAGFEVERRYGTFMDIKHIGKAEPVMGLGENHPNYGQAMPDLVTAVKMVRDELSAYYDNDAISCLFAPLYPDHARNNLWTARKPK